MDNVGIVIVNWNSWPDTLEAVQAAFEMEDFGGPIVICDNGSDDGSVNYFKAWANGEICVLPEDGSPLLYKKSSEHKGPSSIEIIEVNQFEVAKAAWNSGCRLWIVPIGFNAGFARANNHGIEILASLSFIELFWLLNNDAIPTKSACKHLRAQTEAKEGPVIAGSVLLEYWAPGTIQAIGATFNYFSMIGCHLYEGEKVQQIEKLPENMCVDYPVGASLIVNRNFINQIGPMCEDYFLYFEEIDWAIRARKKCQIQPYVVTTSLVYHKGGNSTKGGRNPRLRSAIADYYSIRGRVILSYKISTISLALVLITSPLMAAKRLIRRRRGAFLNSLSALTSGMLWVANDLKEKCFSRH